MTHFDKNRCWCISFILYVYYHACNLFTLPLFNLPALPWVEGLFWSVVYVANY